MLVWLQLQLLQLERQLAALQAQQQMREGSGSATSSSGPSSSCNGNQMNVFFVLFSLAAVVRQAACVQKPFGTELGPVQQSDWLYLHSLYLA
jgi:hypothetical protein